MIAPRNDRKRPLRRRFAEQRLCRVLDGVVAPRADGDPRWLGGLGQGKGQFQHAMVAVGGDVSRRRRWSGYSTTEDESWTAKVPCCRFFSALAVLRRNLASGSASVSVFSRHVPDPSVIVALEGTGRGGCCSREPRRPAGGGLGTAKCVASTARKSCPPAPPIAAMCWAACRRARSRLRGQSVSPPSWVTPGPWAGPWAGEPVKSHLSHSSARVAILFMHSSNTMPVLLLRPSCKPSVVRWIASISFATMNSLAFCAMTLFKSLTMEGGTFTDLSPYDLGNSIMERCGFKG